MGVDEDGVDEVKEMRKRWISLAGLDAHIELIDVVNTCFEDRS